MATRKRLTPTGAERRAQVVQMRGARLSWAEIGRRLNISGQRAGRIYSEALAAIPTQSIDEHRAEALEELDYLARKALEVLERQHVTVSNGHVVSLDGVPLEDSAPVLAAIDRLLRIQERKAKLLGLDAPSKHEVMTLNALDAEIASLTAKMAARADDERP